MQQLTAFGQSVWLDNIRRSMFASGELGRLIDLGLRGMTSNPTIFEKAIGAGSDYDEQLRSLVGKFSDPNDVFEALAIEDIRDAADAFRPLYDSSDAGDGYVSLEVSPLLANDTAGTIATAERLWKAVDRPNVMIKIPCTPACIPAIIDRTLRSGGERLYHRHREARRGRSTRRTRRFGRECLRQPHRHKGRQPAARAHRERADAAAFAAR
jgi:transaldolase